ncbi:MAG: RibD family protein [Enterococcus sp.]
MTKFQIVCHMLTSLDGRVSGQFLNEDGLEPYEAFYYQKMLPTKTNNWICGRKTFAEHFTAENQLDLTPFKDRVIPRIDYLHPERADSFAIAVDPTGKLGWLSNTIGDDFPERAGDHIVTILSEQVSDAYLAYLQKIGVSYLFAGATHELSWQQALLKLHQYLGIERFMVAGGGTINGMFFQAGLIDELSLVVVPTLTGSVDGVSLIETQLPAEFQTFQLQKVEVIAPNGLWLNYYK